MNSKVILFSIVSIVISISVISMNIFQKIIGPHGGTVQSANEFNIETKVSPPDIYAYLLDKKNKPISNKGITCDISFFFFDSPKIDQILKPYNHQGFVLHTNITGYHSYIVNFHLLGKTISSKFENVFDNLVVKKK